VVPHGVFKSFFDVFQQKSFATGLSLAGLAAGIQYLDPVVAKIAPSATATGNGWHCQATGTSERDEHSRRTVGRSNRLWKKWSGSDAVEMGKSRRFLGSNGGKKGLFPLG
jgi:hypothetical protein